MTTSLKRGPAAGRRLSGTAAFGVKAVLLSACLALGTGAVIADERLNFEEIKSTNGPAEPAVYAVTTQDEWQALWSKADLSPPKPLVEGRQTGVALFMGQRPSAGYGIKIRRVSRDEDGRIEIKATEIAPSGAAAQGETAPYVVLLIEGTGNRVVLDYREELGPVPPDETP